MGMRIQKNDIPVKIDTPGAVARQQYGFGDASECGELATEYFSLAAGTDLTPLLEGLEDDLCQSPHWGYLIEGRILVTYKDGEEETVSGGDLFYWPPGHTLRAEQDSEMILFSPRAEHSAVVEHVRRQVAQVS
jgi:hypothetical protein